MDVASQIVRCGAGTFLALLGFGLWAAAIAPSSGAQEGRQQQRAALEELADDLKAPRPETRRSAVKKLADVGTREAWALVMGALADPDGQVADEAQVVLARARDPRVVRDLCERSGLASGDEWITLRAAEALGRVETAFDPRVLLRCVAPNAAELSRTALWSVERLARAKRLGSLVDGTGEIGEALHRWLRSRTATTPCAARPSSRPARSASRSA
jgi:HEAT repeat protein